MSSLVVLGVAAAVTIAAVVLVCRRPPQPGSRVHGQRQHAALAALARVAHGDLTGLGHNLAWSYPEPGEVIGTCLTCHAAAVLTSTDTEGAVADYGGFGGGPGVLLPCPVPR